MSQNIHLVIVEVVDSKMLLQPQEQLVLVDTCQKLQAIPQLNLIFQDGLYQRLLDQKRPLRNLTNIRHMIQEVVLAFKQAARTDHLVRLISAVQIVRTLKSLEHFNLKCVEAQASRCITLSFDLHTPNNSKAFYLNLNI